MTVGASISSRRHGSFLGNLCGCSRENLRVIILCCVWYTCSTLNGVFGKSALKLFPYPITVTLCQLIVINILIPVWYRTKIPVFRPREFVRLVLPLAVLKLLASLSSHISLLKVSVAYSHTVKALMPIFSVALSKMLLGESQTLKVYLSLFPIVGGVILASATELQFDMIGLLSALFSTLMFAIQNIYSKKVMVAGLNHLSLLLVVSWWSLIGLLPIWYYYEGHTILHSGLHRASDDWGNILFYLTGDAIANTLQTITAFTFLSLVTPVTYSIANVAKRIVVIVIAIIVFRTPVTPANAAGMTISSLGIALYNKAKIDEKSTKKKTTKDEQHKGLEYLAKDYEQSVKQL